MRPTPALLAIAFLTGLLWIVAGRKSASACDQERADLECAPGERIAIRGVEYSVRKEYKRPCSFQDGDCRFRVNSDVTPITEQCAGSQVCEILKTRLDHSASSTHCPGSALYRIVHYDCLRDNNIGKICSGGEWVGKTLYLANGEYPLPINGIKTDCYCSISSAPGTKVLINVNELTLSGAKPAKWSEACQQILNISDSSKSTVFDCSHGDGYYGYREIFNGGPEAGVEFRSEAGEEGGRFLLEIKGNDESEITLKCQKEETTPTAVHSQPGAPPTSAGNSDTGPDATAIGLGVAGAVIFIVCVCVIICLVLKKRKKNLERKSSERTMDIGDGVVDPFIVTADPAAAYHNRNGTGTFRQGARKPNEIVYATPGTYSTPWDSHAIPPPFMLSSSPPLPTEPPLPSPPPLPVSPPPQSESHHRNGEPTHYTYIEPDVIPKQNDSPEKPKPAVRRSRAIPSPTEGLEDNSKDNHRAVPQRAGGRKSVSDADTVFIDNSLYESSSR